MHALQPYVEDFIDKCGKERSFYITRDPNIHMAKKFGYVFDRDIGAVLRVSFKVLLSKYVKIR